MSVFDSITSLLSSGSRSSSFPFSGVGSLLLSDISEFSATASEVSPLDVIEVMGRILELERRYIQETLELISARPPSDAIATIRGCSGQDVPVFEFTL